MNINRSLFFLSSIVTTTFSNSALPQNFQSTGSGDWEPPVTLPSIPVSAANLADGRILTWAAYNSNNTYQPYGVDFGETYTSIFDPATNQSDLTLVSSTQHDMFCPGAATLPNGDIFVNGGTSTARTSTFNPLNNSWSMQAAMNIPRAYNSSTVLSNGSVLTLGGSWAEEAGCRRPDPNTPESNCPDKAAEVWSQANGWQVLSGIPANPLRTNDSDGLFRSDNHMWLFTMSGGDVLHAGPSKNMHLLDVTGSGSISNAGTRADGEHAMNGNAVMYDIGKILITGGAPDYENVDATNNAAVIEITNNNVTSRNIVGMAHDRAYHNSVVLPNGEVVVFGGQAHPIPFSDQQSVLAPELWNPTTETFRELAPMSIPRNYHSIALLLNDGRVLVGGGGLCGTCNTNHPDVEIFTPPYLLNSNGNSANRPAIVSTPTVMTYGDNIEVQTNTPISSIVLMRASAVTHSVNNDQRRVPLAFTNPANNIYHAQIPQDSGVATPGNYMLFVLDQNGTPSISKIVNIQSSNPTAGVPTDQAPPTTNILTPTAGQVLNGTQNIAGNATDSGGAGFNSDSVKIAIRDINTNQWYDFSNNTFDQSGAWNSTTASLSNTSNSNTDWSVTTSLPNGSYILLARSVDDADNFMTNAAGNAAWETSTFSVNSIPNTTPSCNGLAITVDLSLGQTPTAGDDVIYGTPDADEIAALGGDDTICTLGGDDTINAGPGNDWVHAGPGNDQVFGLAGLDTLFGGSGADTIIGGIGDDSIQGDDENDVLNGGPGNDSVAGGSGADQIFGQTGDDLLLGGDGDDFILGVAGADVIEGGNGNDTLNGGSDDDEIRGDAGDDTIFGLSGNDVLFGNAGNDFVFGQLGNDTIDGGAGNDQLFGNKGNDTIEALSGLNSLNGGPGNDTLTGGSGNDQIFGDGDLQQAGDDVINGRAGSDLLIGFAGADTITSDDGTADTVNGGPGVDGCATDAVDSVFNCP